MLLFGLVELASDRSLSSAWETLGMRKGGLRRPCLDLYFYFIKLDSFTMPTF